MLTKDHANAIAKKLKGDIRPGSKHDLAVIEYASKRIAQFGIRRGSLHVGPRDAMLLAQCPMSFEEWIARMQEK